MILKYIDESTLYEIEFKKISKNAVAIIGEFPIKTTGFTLSRKDYNDNWDYHTFTTIYRELDNGCQFSNDGSVYVEPEIIEPPDGYMPEYEKPKDVWDEMAEAIKQGVNEV